MNVRSYLILFVFIFACNPTTNNVHVTELDKYKEAKLPERPDKDPIPDQANWAMAAEKGEIVEKSGILISEQKASRCLELKIGYDEMRELYKSDIEIWKLREEMHGKIVKTYEKQIEEMKPSWWSRNRTWICFSLGFVVGGGIVLGSFAAASHMK